MAVSAFAPASIGNVSVGFDILGAALAPIDGTKLGDTVEIYDSDEAFTLENAGAFAEKLPTDPKKNIVYDCYVDFKAELDKRGIAVKNMRMVLKKDLPIGTGLGSSACSVVAACLALNAFHDSPLTEDECMGLMGREEGRISGSVHYDNVAPCYLGGIQLIVDEGGVISSRVPEFKDWFWVSCYPGIFVSTAEARKILPTSYDRHTSIDFARRMGAFVQASHVGNAKLAAMMLKDVIAEPYRKSLIPGFDAAREHVMANGGLAMGISGSGPSIFAVAPNLEIANALKSWLEDNFIQNSDGFCNVCRIDSDGATVSNI